MQPEVRRLKYISDRVCSLSHVVAENERVDSTDCGPQRFRRADPLFPYTLAIGDNLRIQHAMLQTISLVGRG